HVERFVEPSVRDQFHLHVQILGDVVDLFLAEIRERRHSLFGEALRQHRSDGFALLIVEDGHRADQVRTFRASRLVAVAEAAIRGVELFAAGPCRSTGRRPESEKLADTAAAASAAATGWDLLLSKERQRSRKDQNPQ